MKILLLESFYTSSHKQWADGLIMQSNHNIRLISLPGRHWKWRMHHAGKYFASEISKLKTKQGLILCSDLMNVAEFRGILAALGNGNSWYNKIPVVTYFHENQITYPWSEDDPDVDLKRDNHYGWINYISCISSDYILFNSEFHKTNFINALPGFLKQFPDGYQEDSINLIEKKSSVLPIGLDLKDLTKFRKIQNSIPVILWNHRWEYDKNPELFFHSLFELKEKNYEFKVIVAGESYKKYPKIFDLARKELADRIIHFGFAKSKSQYYELLLKSDILPVTSNQDFFGISVIEAIAAGCIPILPNRLAFPEHLNAQEYQDYYYNTTVELKERISQFIEKHPQTSSSIQHHILKYDWRMIAAKYDAFFENIVQTKIT